MITFQEFLEIAESSTPEKGGRALSPHGPKKNKYSRGRQRQDTSNKAAIKKAGFRRSPPKSSEDVPSDVSSNSDHHYTDVGTYKNQSHYASDNMGRKKPYGERVKPTNKRVIKAKSIRKQMGGDRTTKPVHDVSINSNDGNSYHAKNDSENLISRGKSFKKEIRAVPKALKNAGAKPGDKVSSTPMGIMPGENRKEGAKKRGKLYAKELGAKMNPKTGKTMGTVRG